MSRKLEKGPPDRLVLSQVAAETVSSPFRSKKKVDRGYPQ